MRDKLDPLEAAHRRVNHRTIWLVWLVPVGLATAVATVLFFAERNSGDGQAAMGMLAIAVLWLIAVTTATVTAAIASFSVWITRPPARRHADAMDTGSENDQQAEAIRHRSRRILGAALVAATFVGVALLIAIAFASFPYTPSEQKCGEVYGYGNSRIGIHDADDCLGRSGELRGDGQFRSTKKHCDALTPDAVRKDDRCKGRQAEKDVSTSAEPSGWLLDGDDAGDEAEQ